MSDDTASQRRDQGSAGGDEPATPARGRRLRRLFAFAGALLAAWLVLALAVLWWQPGRLWQVAIGVALPALAIWLPRRTLAKIGWGILSVVLFAATFYLPSWALSREIEFTIRSAARDAAKDMYLVHTDYGAKADDDPGETFRNDDAPLFWKVNSSDWDGVLRNLEGRRVRARVIGIRFADRSLYKNIIWVEAIGDPAAAQEAASHERR